MGTARMKGLVCFPRNLPQTRAVGISASPTSLDLSIRFQLWVQSPVCPVLQGQE